MQSKINELLSQGIDVSFYQALTQHDIRKYEHQYQVQIPLEYQQFLMHLVMEVLVHQVVYSH